MMHITSKTKNNFVHPFGLAITFAVIMVTLIFSCPVSAKAPKQKTFGSPDEAFKAVVTAMKARDTRELTAIFGPDSKNIVFSGDEVADKSGRDNFVRAYEEKNRLETVNGNKAILYVGNNDWPMPIPVVKKGNGWRFDTKAGKEEILQRRIGKNELNAIQACKAYVDAQLEYAPRDYDGDGLFEYAQKFLSAPGKKDGLYWETKEGEQKSPLGAFIAGAAREGYFQKEGKGKKIPFHGYYYIILREQGKDAPGGAYSYVANGKMIGGFALVAYPAQYGNSGVMTFIVNKDGLVYQKDLGKNTAKIAQGIKAYNPDKTWKKAE
ncbi:MAG: DUF2950 domain-containing protein [Deltaproteobacteria bacterium]|nr:DUF2950 domain-containing protein [Deltaproteobacteria bacterium]